MMSMELAKRAVACKGWRWMPGMRDMGGNVYLGQYANHHDRHGWCRFDRGQWIWGVDDFGLPDITDPATLGCLLHLVREAWDDECASVWIDYRTGMAQWMARGCHHGVWRPSDADGYYGDAEALVAALEAAP